MKNILYKLSLALILTISIQSCTNTANKSQNTTDKNTQKEACCSTKETCCTVQNDSAEIKAYYFHATRRCATCEAVESVTQETILEYYNGTVSFLSINREENKDNPMLEKYKVSGQTLLIIKDDKVVNLTNDAFMNARTKPDKFVAKIKSTIDSML